MKKLRTRHHTVVLNRSRGGDTGITIILVLFGFLMVIPFWFVVVDAFKPLDELWYWPPRPYVVHPHTEELLRLDSPYGNVLGTVLPVFIQYICYNDFRRARKPDSRLAGGIFAVKAELSGKKRHVQADCLDTYVPAVCCHDRIIYSVFQVWLDGYLASDSGSSMGSTIGLYLMKNFMDSSVAVEVLESARLDGSSEWNTFLKIAMPMVKPAWLTLIVYSFQSLWVTGASPYIFSEDLKTFYYAIQQVLNAGVTRAGAGAASNVVMMIVPIVVFVISQSQIIETMGSSGLKD